jgi:hypothetical protein
MEHVIKFLNYFVKPKPIMPTFPFDIKLSAFSVLFVFLKCFSLYPSSDFVFFLFTLLPGMAPAKDFSPSIST